MDTQEQTFAKTIADIFDELGTENQANPNPLPIFKDFYTSIKLLHQKVHSGEKIDQPAELSTFARLQNQYKELIAGYDEAAMAKFLEGSDAYLVSIYLDRVVKLIQKMQHVPHHQ